MCVPKTPAFACYHMERGGYHMHNRRREDLERDLPTFLLEELDLDLSPSESEKGEREEAAAEEERALCAVDGQPVELQSASQEIWVRQKHWRILGKDGAVRLPDIPLSRQLSIGELVVLFNEDSAKGELMNAYVVSVGLGKVRRGQPTLNVEVTSRWAFWLTIEDCFCGGLLA